MIDTSLCIDALIIERVEVSERPQHKVALSRPLQMSATEVTVGRFRRFFEAVKYVTHAVRLGSGNSVSKLSNAFGLFDMHGNLQKWCGNDSAVRCRSAFRNDDPDSLRDINPGFRVVAELAAPLPVVTNVRQGAARPLLISVSQRPQARLRCWSTGIPLDDSSENRPRQFETGLKPRRQAPASRAIPGWENFPIGGNSATHPQLRVPRHCGEPLRTGCSGQL